MEILQIFVLLKGRQMFMSTQVYYKKVCTFLESKFLLVAARIVQSDRLTVNLILTYLLSQTIRKFRLNYVPLWVPFHISEAWNGRASAI